jgi:hypothetical protein
MKLFRRMIVGLLVMTLMLLLSMSGIVAQGDSAVRFVHVVPNTAPIDVYVNGSLAVVNLGYGEATGYITVPAGNHTVTVTATGISTSLWEQQITADASPATFIASTAGQFDRYNDNLTPLALGMSRLLLVHALAGGSNVDVQLAESIAVGDSTFDKGFAIAADMAYGASFGSFDLPSQTYVVNVVPTGTSDTIIEALPLALDNGTSQMAIVYGTASNPQALMLAAPTTSSGDTGLVRFVHGVVGAPAVDVYAADTLVAPLLDTNNPTVHMALPAGEHAVELRAGDEVVASGTITVEAGSAQTAVALADGDVITIAVFADDVSGVTETTAVATVINTITEATTTVELSSGTALSDELAFGEASDAVSFDPTAATVGFNLTLGDAIGTLVGSDVTFYGGNYYNIIVLDGNAFSAPTTIIAATTLAQTLASAPGAGTTIAASGTVQNVEVIATQPAVAQQATPVPTQAPVASAGDGVVTAQVILDPSANLQLRQLPDADSLSLGLAPSNSSLVIEGREGRPEALAEGQEAPPEAEEFVDPAEGLAPDADLDPATTWLRVVYTTPDGGEIEAWVLAQFLAVRDDEGRIQRLANLPTVPRNLPGEARATELTPPPTREDIVTARVYNLNPGTSVNMRRTPTTEGEVLARLSLDTVVELVGFLDVTTLVAIGTGTPTPTAVPTELFVEQLDEVAWVFVSYNPPEGGTITGWVSTTYVQFFWNGERVDPEELFARELTQFVDSTTRGAITGNAQQAALPTIDPLKDVYVAQVLLDANANLQFRRTPDAQSESIGLIPSGTQLIVSARTPLGEWLETSFEGQTGWIAAQFVTVTFNGQPVPVTDIPVAAEVTPEATEQVAPALTPTPTTTG